MPYQPSERFDTSAISGGFNNAAASISTILDRFGINQEAERKKTELMQQQDAANEQVLQHALSKQLITQADYNNYRAAPMTVRKSIADGLSLNIADDFARQRYAAEQDFRNRQLSGDPRAGIPQLLTAPDGTTIPGQYYVPGAKAVINTNRNPPTGSGAVPLPPGLTVPPGFEWNGKELIQRRDSGQDDDITQLQSMTTQRKLSSIDRQIAEAQGEIATGNRRPGPDWLHLGTSYSDQLQKLELQRAAATGNSDSAVTPAPVMMPGTQQQPAPVSQQPSVDKTAALAQAQAKIQAGANRAAVIERLKQLGVDPTGL